jgi:asparagine synthase (glutamine-hydrolysing)
MNEAISHRGPDGAGIFLDANIGLGHRRLAILDLSDRASQPMATSDGRFVISYNGEVYNYKELRSELEQKGYRFRSTSDTEVILSSFVEWGEDSVSLFNGMFALAIWDTRDKRLFLARDRYGIKPLYYMAEGGVFLFGSEQKAILQHPAVHKSFDLEALLEYFTFQNIFTDKTFFKTIKMFPSGSYAWIEGETDTRGLSFCQYWDFNFIEPDVVRDEREYCEELDRLFSQAVKRQLISDVEVGAYLSGGMDSGSITAIASQNLPCLKTFTCGFDLSSASGLELNFDERVKAEAMSYQFQSEHYEMVLKAGDMERCLPRLAWHLEEPRVGQSYPNYYAAHLASKFTKVVLTGTGGDELFGGYPWRYYRATRNDSFENYIDKYYLFWQRLIPNSEIAKIFSPVWQEVKHVWTRDIFEKVFRRRPTELSSPEDFINSSLYFEAKTFLHGLLVVEDKLSMAHGLESRVPFLDNDLVDFAMRLPVRLKLGSLDRVVRINENEPDKPNQYFKQTKDGKLILRKMMSRHIPSSVVNRVKQGFSAPDASWFKGDSIGFVRSALFNDDAKIYAYMDPNAVQRLLQEHLDGRVNRRLLIWSLLNVEEWLHRFID